MSVEFVDSNILLYAHAGDAGRRHEIALDLMTRLATQRCGALSIQVLAEFYASGTGKLRMPVQTAERIIVNLKSWLIHRPSHQDLLQAIEIQRRYHLSWWDAMIVNSAIEAQATILWTEDLNDGQKIGSLTIRNPFKSLRS